MSRLPGWRKSHYAVIGLVVAALGLGAYLYYTRPSAHKAIPTIPPQASISSAVSAPPAPPASKIPVPLVATAPVPPVQPLAVAATTAEPPETGKVAKGDCRDAAYCHCCPCRCQQPKKPYRSYSKPLKKSPKPPVSSARRRKVTLRKKTGVYRCPTTVVKAAPPQVAQAAPSQMAPAPQLEGCSYIYMPPSALFEGTTAVKGFVGGPRGGLAAFDKDACTAISEDGGRTFTSGWPDAVCSDSRTDPIVCDFRGKEKAAGTQTILRNVSFFVHPGRLYVLRLPGFMSDEKSKYVTALGLITGKINPPQLLAVDRIKWTEHNAPLSGVGWPYYKNRRAAFGPKSDPYALHFFTRADWDFGRF